MRFAPTDAFYNLVAYCPGSEVAIGSQVDYRTGKKLVTGATPRMKSPTMKVRAPGVLVCILFGGCTKNRPCLQSSHTAVHEHVVTDQECEPTKRSWAVPVIQFGTEPCEQAPALSIAELCVAADAVRSVEEFQDSTISRIAVVDGDHRMKRLAMDNNHRVGEQSLFLSTDGELLFFALNYHTKFLVKVILQRGRTPTVHLNRCYYRDRNSPTD